MKQTGEKYVKIRYDKIRSDTWEMTSAGLYFHLSSRSPIEATIILFSTSLHTIPSQAIMAEPNLQEIHDVLFELALKAGDMITSANPSTVDTKKNCTPRSLEQMIRN